MVISGFKGPKKYKHREKSELQSKRSWYAYVTSSKREYLEKYLQKI